jgi:hypothetical protein
MLYEHIPHPHIELRKGRVLNKEADTFNSWLGVKITAGVGTMWCAYAFAILALLSLPEAIHSGLAALIAWIAQTFLQLVLLSIIMVGQKVSGDAADKQADDTYKDVEAILHESTSIQQHLMAQDVELEHLIEKFNSRCPKEK